MRIAEFFNPGFFGRIYDKFFKIQTFFVKKMAFFNPLDLNLPEVDTLKLQPYSFQA